MVKRICLLLLTLILICGSSYADLKLGTSTPGLEMLRDYMARVNTFLAESGEEEINKVFDQQKTVVEMGITALDDAYEPENVTVTVYLTYNNIHYLLLRSREPERFPAIAAAFRRALNPETISAEEALKIPAARTKKAVSNPGDSFEDQVEEDRLQGTAPREFYAYYPNQYRDGVNWIQLMIIFPLEGYQDEDRGIISSDTGTKPPPSDEDQDEGYEGYNPTDDYTHLELFTTPTPEPDSAAAEFDDYD